MSPFCFGGTAVLHLTTDHHVAWPPGHGVFVLHFDQSHRKAGTAQRGTAQHDTAQRDTAQFLVCGSHASACVSPHAMCHDVVSTYLRKEISLGSTALRMSTICQAEG